MLRVIRPVTTSEIEDHLVKLGAGNHSDNMTRVKAFPRHYLLFLSEPEFMDLVFLQIPMLSKIAPKGHDRQLRAVAERASALNQNEMHLGKNWDIEEALTRFEALDHQANGSSLTALLLRDAHGAEARWSPDGWYLQDGSHRALAYCIKILSRKTQYLPQAAFCATYRRFNVD